MFIDGRYHPQLSDDLAASGVEVSVDNQRQHLPHALQPEVFLHLTESGPDGDPHSRAAQPPHG